MKSVYDLLGATKPFDPSYRFVTSWLLPPVALAIIRFLLSLYVFTTIFFTFGWYDSHHQSITARQSFSYFTDLGYWGLAFYFLFSSLHTFSYLRRGGPWLHRWPRPLQAAHAIFYTTIVTYPILITAVFWAILYKGHWFPVIFNAWSNTSMHALNTVFASFEIFMTRTSPPPPSHLIILIIILAMYVGLAYLTHDTEGFYTYDFLDPSNGNGKVAGYAFGILAAIIVIFGVVWCVIWVRRWLTETILGFEAKSSREQRDDDLVDTEMTVQRTK
ncbi:MAG: hypothetical protein Q9191_005556 [Dirinaria sp. TL-2023a]